MKITLPNGKPAPDWVYRCKDVVLHVSTKAPDGGLPKDEEDDGEDDSEDDSEPLQRCGLRLAVDNDDVDAAEVEFALQRLINDLHTSGWKIDAIDGAG